MQNLTVLEYLKRQIAGNLPKDAITKMKYPTAISQTLGIRLVSVELGTATVEIDADAKIHGNQQGTVHGGLLSELADAAIGTAHSTVVGEDESFASIDLKINFIRPVWKATLQATAKPIHSGQTISHYHCDITGENGKLIATVISSVMTLRGDKAVGR